MSLPKKFPVLIFFLFLAFISTSQVSAHVLRTDGTVGALLHIDPEDSPIANSTASFAFEFKDNSGKFDPKNCTCIATIYESGNQIYSTDIFADNPNPSLTSSSFSFTFPRKDVYELKVTGGPTNGTGFKPFALTYDIRVDREANSSQSQNSNTLLYHIVHYGGFVALFFAFVILLFVQNKRTKRNTL